MKIIYEGYPELNVGFYQSKWKVGKHDAIHGLPYTIKEFPLKQRGVPLQYLLELTIKLAE